MNKRRTHRNDKIRASHSRLHWITKATNTHQKKRKKERCINKFKSDVSTQSNNVYKINYACASVCISYRRRSVVSHDYFFLSPALLFFFFALFKHIVPGLISNCCANAADSFETAGPPTLVCGFQNSSWKRVGVRFGWTCACEWDA